MSAERLVFLRSFESEERVLHVFATAAFDGEPRAMEQQPELRFVDPEKLLTYTPFVPSMNPVKTAIEEYLAAAAGPNKEWDDEGCVGLWGDNHGLSDEEYERQERSPRM